MKIQDCSFCGNCLICPYLSKYGYPRDIYNKKDQSVFICTNCGACDILCPLDLEPSRALYSLKTLMIKEGSLSKEVIQAIQSARNFTNIMSRFPISHVDYRETILFPGCSLLSMGSKIVYGIKKCLEVKMNEKIGITIHCCGDPLFQNGDVSTLSNFLKNLKEKLKRTGTSKIVFACGNCYKIFRKYMNDFELIHVSQLLSKEDIKEPINDFILHHPCPNFKNREIINYMERNFVYKNMESIKNPYCCGLGGSASKLDKDVSKEFLEKIKNLAKSRRVLTSCMGCKNRFMKYNIEAKHIFEVISGVNINKPLEEKDKWFNRFYISLRTKINFTKIFLFLLIMIGIFIVQNLHKNQLITIDKLVNFVKTSKFLAPLIYLLIYTIGPSIFFPSLILTIVSGMLWGPFWGVVFAITGATMGSSLPFLLSRYIFHDSVKRMFGIRKWERLKSLVEKNGWKVVAFTRIVPIFPFPVLNYLFGITPIKFLPYLVASFFSMLPACIAYVYFGSSIFELITKRNFTPLIVGVLLVSIIMIMPWFLKKSSFLSKNKSS